MTRHLSEDLISQWVDRELDPRQAAQVEEHLKNCENCHAVQQEISALSRLYQTETALEPPPYLWNRIAAQIGEESRSERRRFFSLGRLLPRDGLRQPAWIGTPIWAPAAVLLVVISCTLAIMHYQAAERAQSAAIMEIDRAHSALTALNTKNYNPFHEPTAMDTGTNPFTRIQLKDQPNPFRNPQDRP
jgi:anti-sigma factor RsiW